VARQQYESARNGASQQVQALEAARARVTLARKAVADTVVRAPFAGLVADRGVSVGDWVNRGASVATVVRVDPLRVELTVPEQAVARIAEGQAVVLTVDAYPGRSFEARVRFVSPTLRADQRALTVEAILPNADGLLKPGLFASAEIETTADSALVVPAPVVQTSGATSRLFVGGDRVESASPPPEAGDMADVDGVAQGDLVVLDSRLLLGDGMRVTVN
jgi:membrane fusion protein (multidrug efflux system)